MDPRPEISADDSVIVAGLGHIRRAADAPSGVAGAHDDPMPYLRAKKLRKYMGVQDDLAVVSVGRALANAGFDGVSLGERAGLYLVVGHIPFDRADLDPLTTASIQNGRFSMEAFSTSGFRAVNGLLTFRCLPNMPAFHASVAFDIQGPYFVTYPGAGQFYLALEEAYAALTAGAIDVAIVGGVAHQRNFLVERHFARLDPPIPPERLIDSAGCMILETAAHARNRGAKVRGRLLRYAVAYAAHDPFESAELMERFDGAECDQAELGAASLPVALSVSAEKSASGLRHTLVSRDGIHANSHWELT